MAAQVQIWVPQTDSEGVKVTFAQGGVEITLATINPGEDKQFSLYDATQLRVSPINQETKT